MFYASFRLQANLTVSVILHRALQPFTVAELAVSKRIDTDQVEAQRATRARIARSARNWSGVVSRFRLAEVVVFIPALLPAG